MTLYASFTDKALAYSKKLHNDTRVGERGSHIFIKNCIQSVDATNLPCPDFFDHGYFSQAEPILLDIHNLFTSNMSPDQRIYIVPATSSAGQYWKFNPHCSFSGIKC